MPRNMYPPTTPFVLDRKSTRLSILHIKMYELHSSTLGDIISAFETLLPLNQVVLESFEKTILEVLVFLPRAIRG